MCGKREEKREEETRYFNGISSECESVERGKE
jgi:hypothetical protein